MQNTFLTIFLGFILGMEHALEADHLIAVSTLVSKYKKPLKSALVGAYWGIGHTTTLFIVGLLVLVLKVNISTNISLLFEFFVGIMLIILGLKAFFYFKKESHSHEHNHDRIIHDHAHLHILKDHHSRKGPFLVGLVHGLAGSGALMILVLSTVRDITLGVYYILVFGFGSVLGMSLMSLLISLPLSIFSKKTNNLEKYISIIAGFFSVSFGLYIMYKTGISEGLLVKLL